ncbi:unnamed protein product [Clonostachys rosea f. rosea IK726]|uniref:Uncharacterized protein n=1 Tax=Clonostachys rosea f. rosea IK726 TaxID=1349383 RepID=A0ACA9T7T0_BIOOC|nr:unnamed protein product [Clonostachys rosea f. rosea IK726]
MPKGLAPPPTAELCPRRTADSAPRMPTIEAPYTPYRWGQGKAMAPSPGGASTKSSQTLRHSRRSGMCVGVKWSGSSEAVCPISSQHEQAVTGPRFIMITYLHSSGVHNYQNPCSTNFSLPTFSPEALKLY